jgi:hypothetical protein
MAKKKVKSSSKSSKKTKPVSKPKAKIKPVKKAKKPVAKAIAKDKPQPTAQAAQQDFVEKYKQETGMALDKPASVNDFSKKLEETAKLVTSEKLPDKELPSFTKEHEEKAAAKEKPTEADIPKVSSDTQSMLDQLKKPADKPVEKPVDQKADLHPHDKMTIGALVWSLVGILIPIAAIVGFILALKAYKQGSHTAKGTMLLAIFTFIINLVLILLFLKYFIFAP